MILVPHRIVGGTIEGPSSGQWPAGDAEVLGDVGRLAASHLIIDLRLDFAQVSRILGHARVITTLDVYTHLFDEVRHSHEVRGRLSASAFAALLGAGQD